MSCYNLPFNIPVTIIIGRTASFAIEIDLSDELDDLIFGVKQTVDDTTYICSASMSGGNVTRNGNTYYLTVPDETTASVSAGKYVYEIMADYGGERFALVLSNATFRKGVINNA